MNVELGITPEQEEKTLVYRHQIIQLNDCPVNNYLV